MNAQDIRNLSEAYMEVYQNLDEGRGWRDNPGQNIPNNLAVNSVRRHLEKSGKTRKPTPTNLARRELKARELEKKSKDLETRDRTNNERWQDSTINNPHSRTDNSSTSSRLRSRAKAIRAVSKSQTRRTADDEDNQRIANSVSRTNRFNDLGSGRDRRNSESNFDKSTSHLDLSRVDPDSYGTKRKTKKKSDLKSSDETTITKKDKKLIYKWHGSPRFSDRWESPSTPKNKIVKFKKEETDLYDIILSHLLGEGYAETPEAAESIMVNMGEEWISTILEVHSVDAERLLMHKYKNTGEPYRQRQYLKSKPRKRTVGN